MKITITINTSEPVYPVLVSMQQLEDFIDLVRRTIRHETEEAGRYPASISDQDAPGSSAITTISATIERDGVTQTSFLQPADGEQEAGQGELW